MYSTLKISDSIHHICESPGVYCTLVLGSEKALLIDTGNGWSNIAQAVKDITDLPVLVVNTHGHFDHASGNGFFPEVLIHEDDVSLLKKHRGWFYRYGYYLLARKGMDPDERRTYRTIKKKCGYSIKPLHDGDIIDLGDTRIEVIACPGHTQGSICLLDTKNRYLFTGDSLSNHVWICLKESTNLDTYANSLEKIASRSDDFDHLLSAHGRTIMTKKVLDAMISCVKNLSFGQSRPYKRVLLRKTFIYEEGLEHMRKQYGITSFSQILKNLVRIREEDFSEARYMSVVFSKDKI